MARKIAIGFDPQGIRVPLDRLLPLRATKYQPANNHKHQSIAASIRAIGVIEPLIIYPQEGNEGHYVILDGNIRYAVLKEMAVSDAYCLIANDDEAYTYNHKVSVVTPIQEHFMILKAIDLGVAEERIAETLNVDVAAIRRKRNLLEGICPEAITLLKDRRIAPEALRQLKRVVPIRQIEMADLMCRANNLTVSYAQCLFMATPDEQRLAEYRAMKSNGVSTEDREHIAREMQNLHRELKLIEKTHSENVMNLLVMVRYVEKLLQNARVVKHLGTRYPEILQEFQKMIAAPELAGPVSRNAG